VRALRHHDGAAAARVMREHVEGTNHILAAFLPPRG
jgi:DNA-binding GntR family transcriptional regulator